MNFKTLIKPRHIYFETDSLTETFGRFFAEPLQRGFGNTIGNSLRRVLLSSIRGTAVVSIRLQGPLDLLEQRLRYDRAMLTRERLVPQLHHPGDNRVG